MSEFAPPVGIYIKATVIPAGLSVTAAAQRLGVSRPALSNLLNGKAALSPEMALRLERTFGASSQDLIQRQAAHERAKAQVLPPTIAVRTHAPSVLTIKAAQIETWADSMAARTELPALIRRLVVSTASGLSEMDFPAFEEGERPGWDGRSVAVAATPWVPAGASGWELGVSTDPAQKAESDYRQRTRSVPAAQRAETTLVFVTPRNWRGKAVWAEAKRATGQWKGVRAYDASDLEQWLEDSVPAQAWLGERLPFGAKDIDTLDTCWTTFAEATDPPLSKILFKPTAEDGAQKLKTWLDNDAIEPFTVAAASETEALAALACAFEAEPLVATHAGDRVVVVRSATALAKISSAAADLIVVLASAEAEEASGGRQRGQHTIIVTRRNAITDEPNLTVDLVDDETFRNGLLEMGFGHEEIEPLGGDSGHSRTVLRRRLSRVPAIQTPPWAADAALAERLIPLMLVGAWNASSEADLAVLTTLAQTDEAGLEKTVVELAANADAPVWSVGTARGVVSKVDAFYAVRHRVTKPELDRFFEVARLVLSEVDPALEMPEEKRWMSNVYGKVRKHSGILRQGFCETLVLLSVHGDNLFRQHLGYDVKAKVDTFIRELLTPFDATTWQSQRNDLPRYAEAAPEVFMNLLKQDLASSDPKVFSLMAPAGTGPWSSPGRTGLLWGLETLAWNPKWLFQVVDILGALSEVTLADNWVNKPENSLESIFRAWYPQTAAPVETRIAALRRLVAQHPTVGWRMCMAQIDPMGQVGHHSARPRWRNDATGHGTGATYGEIHATARAALDIALAWPTPTAATLSDLVQWIDHLGDFQDAVWDAVTAWIAADPPEVEKAKLRERIRQTTMTTRARRRDAPPITATQAARARTVYDALAPADLIWRHRWLFAQQWVEHSADELGDENLDFNAREARISAQRSTALREIWEATGSDGVARLCANSEAPWNIGWILGGSVFTAEENAAYAATLASQTLEPPLASCLAGLLSGMPAEQRAALLADATAGYPANARFSAEAALTMLRQAPFTNATWDLAAALGEAGHRAYWADVNGQMLRNDDDSDPNRVIDELLAVERPRCAFRVVELVLEVVTSENLLRLLHMVATCDKEITGQYVLAQHRLSDAFDTLSQRVDVESYRLAQLEFFYIDALSHSRHGIRNLERQLSESPELFFQAVSFAYHRSDGGIDPPELRVANPEAAAETARRAHTLLRNVKRLPGTDESGGVDVRALRDWIQRVRSLTREHGRETVGDLATGEYFGCSGPGADGVWPNEALREVLETHGTEDLKRGMMTGRFNARGVHWRGEGGGQERAISQEYAGWAAQLASDYPFTAQMLDDLAAAYARDAEREDTQAHIRRRLRH